MKNHYLRSMITILVASLLLNTSVSCKKEDGSQIFGLLALLELQSGNSEESAETVTEIYIYSTADSSTDNVYKGNLGGRSGADEKCSAAKPAGLKCNTVHAFISVDADDEIRDMIVNYSIIDSLPVKSGDGTELAASFSGFLTAVYETGKYNGKVSVPNHYIWTGTEDSAGSLGTETCNQWTSSASADSGSASDIEFNAQTLSFEELNPCDMEYPLICVCY